MKPAVRSLLAVIMVLTSMAAAPARSEPITGDGRRATLYLHSSTPVALTDQLQSQVDAGATGPTMDETAPTGATPKTAMSSGIGNPNFRKNFLLGFWAAEVHGHITNAGVKLWMVVRGPQDVTVTLFGDGGVGVGGVVGRATGRALGNGPVLLELDVPVDASINQELVMSVDAGSVTGGGRPAGMLYDSVDHPSSLSFDIDAYVPPPPFGVAFPPAAGWDEVAPVSLTKANRESSLAVNPADEDEMLVCDPSGVPNLPEGHSYFHITRDGGATWSEFEIEPEGDPRAFAFEGGDCDVAYDAAGTMYVADTWLGNLSVGASSDGGGTWTGTPIAVQAPVVDRPWLVGGPAGTVYLTYQDVQFAMPSVIWFLKSTDYGRTFSVGAPLATASVEGTHTWTGNFVVSPTGNDIYSVYTRRQSGVVLGSLDSAGPETVWVATSHDGGTTWTQRMVASMSNPASYLYPAIAMDAGGGLHVVFASKREGDRPVWYATSTDEAVTWSDPIPVTTGGSGFAPWVAARAPGEVAVIWYGSPNPAANVGAGQHDWYLYWARISGGGATIISGTTTTNPLYHGVAAMPEFNQVRLDSQGNMRIGASVYGGPADGGNWVAYYQQEDG